MTDLSLESQDQVLALINKDNDLQLTAEQVTLGLPANAVEGIPKVDVVVTAKPDFPYQGSVKVSYDRLFLAGLPALAGGIGVMTERNVTFEQFIGSINELYGINLSPDDLEPNGPFNLNIGLESQLVPVKSKPGSFVYQGDANFTAYFDYVRIPVPELETTVLTYGMTINEGMWKIFNDPQPFPRQD